MSALLTSLKNKYISMRGFHTPRHLLVIESDDWGSIRMPSVDTYSKLQVLGDEPQNDAFLRNDSLECEEDLLRLFGVLSSVTDSNGKPAVITANFAMANPDFDKIDPVGGVYENEPFYNTYLRYFSKSKVLETVFKGMESGVFYPQLHCREHLNVNRWMYDLKNGKADTVMAFENRMIGVNSSFSSSNIFGYMDAFNTDHTTINELENIFVDAQRLFEETFGYKSKSFVASCFVWPKEFEEVLARNGVIGIQSAPWQNCAVGSGGEYKLKRKLHYTGQKNRNGQIFTVRNCNYEPSYYQNPDECVKQCFNDICEAFNNRKPAIINSHRVNYISTINPKNAEDNLHGLEVLLNMVRKRFSDIEFITTKDLIEIIQGESNE